MKKKLGGGNVEFPFIEKNLDGLRALGQGDNLKDDYQKMYDIALTNEKQKQIDFKLGKKSDVDNFNRYKYYWNSAANIAKYSGIVITELKNTLGHIIVFFSKIFTKILGSFSRSTGAAFTINSPFMRLLWFLVLVCIIIALIVGLVFAGSAASNNEKQANMNKDKIENPSLFYNSGYDVNNAMNAFSNFYHYYNNYTNYYKKYSSGRDRLNGDAGEGRCNDTTHVNNEDIYDNSNDATYTLYKPRSEVFTCKNFKNNIKQIPEYFQTDKGYLYKHKIYYDYIKQTNGTYLLDLFNGYYLQPGTAAPVVTVTPNPKPTTTTTKTTTTGTIVTTIVTDPENITTTTATKIYFANSDENIFDVLYNIYYYYPLAIKIADNIMEKCFDAQGASKVKLDDNDAKLFSKVCKNAVLYYYYKKLESDNKRTITEKEVAAAGVAAAAAAVAAAAVAAGVAAVAAALAAVKAEKVVKDALTGYNFPNEYENEVKTAFANEKNDTNPTLN